MPANNWEMATIGDLLRRNGGGIKTGPFGTALKASEYAAEGVPLISVGEIGYGSLRIHRTTPRVPASVIARLPDYLLEPGDIVFGRKGAVDRSALVKPQEAGWFLGSDGIRLRLPKSCDAHFMAYQLQSPMVRAWLLQHATGTTMASLNQNIIERIPIVLPPLVTQHEIAGILKPLDDKIDLNRRITQTLEDLAHALFQSWFVDFDPVHAKAQGRQPTGMDTETAALFPNRFIGSELGELPQGWTVETLGNWVSLQRGTTYKSGLVGMPGPILLGLASIRRDGGFRHDSLRTYGGESPPKLIVKHGNLYVSLKDVTQSGDLLGAVARVPKWLGEGRLTQDTVRLDFLSTEAPHRTFVYWLLRSNRYREYCRARAIGTTNLSLSREDFLSFRFVVPNSEVLARLTLMLATLTHAEDSNENKILSGIRDTLLPKLLSDELRVGEVEGHMAASA